MPPPRILGRGGANGGIVVRHPDGFEEEIDPTGIDLGAAGVVMPGATPPAAAPPVRDVDSGIAQVTVVPPGRRGGGVAVTHPRQEGETVTRGDTVVPADFGLVFPPASEGGGARVEDIPGIDTAMETSEALRRGRHDRLRRDAVGQVSMDPTGIPTYRAPEETYVLDSAGNPVPEAAYDPLADALRQGGAWLNEHLLGQPPPTAFRPTPEETLFPGQAPGQAQPAPGAPGQAPAPAHRLPAQPAPPTLDDLMLGGVPADLNPAVTQGVIDEQAGGTPGVNAQIRQVDRAEQVARHGAQLEGDAARARGGVYDQMLAERRQLEEDRRLAMGQARQRFTRALDRVQAMQIDPAHFFQDSGRTIGATLAVALGAIGTAVSGDPRHQQMSLSLINQAVERDIQAQAANIDNAQENLDQESNLVGMMRTEFQDRDAAMNAAHAIMLGQVDQQIAGWQAGLHDEQAQQQAEALRLQIRQDAARSAQEAIRAEEDRQIRNAYQMARTAREMRRAGMGGGGGGGRGGPRGVAGARLAGFDDSVAAVEDQASAGDARGGDMYGAGMFETRVPDALLSLLSPERMRGRQQMRNAIAQYALQMTGQSATDQQMERLEAIIMGAGSEEDVRNGVEMMRSMVAAQMGHPRISIDQLMNMHMGRTGG